MSVFWLTTSTSGRLHLVRCRTCMASTVVSSLREVGAWQRAHDVLVCVDTMRAQRRTRVGQWSAAERCWKHPSAADHHIQTWESCDG